MIVLNDCISYIEGCKDRLSAEVFLIKGEKNTYVVDVGSTDRPYESIFELANKKIIITHFHGDHTYNLKRLSIADEDLLVGDYTAKYFGFGTVVNAPLNIEDGVKISVLPIPNSHAKGSLTVLVNSDILIMGDSFYSCDKGYNVSKLYDEIQFLRSLEFNYAVLSHKVMLRPKEKILTDLEYIYSKRKKDSPYIKI